MTAVAFLGLGRMGTPMAANLVAAGHQVTVYNRTAEKAEAFATTHGCAMADTPAKAAATADVVITMLADDAAVREAVQGSAGALVSAREGTVVVDMSTVSPTTSRSLADACRDAGVGFLDAPVSGSTKAATEAALTLMIGGDGDVLDRARPVLGVLGQRVVHLGGSGAGASMKLVVNAILHGLNNAVSESLVLAEAVGIDRAAAYEVLTQSAIAAPFVNYRQQSFVAPESTPVLFALDLAVKDVGLALDLADEVGASMPQARTNLQTFKAASDAGLGDHDESAVAVHLRRVSEQEI